MGAVSSQQVLVSSQLAQRPLRCYAHAYDMMAHARASSSLEPVYASNRSPEKELLAGLMTAV